MKFHRKKTSTGVLPPKTPTPDPQQGAHNELCQNEVIEYTATEVGLGGRGLGPAGTLEIQLRLTDPCPGFGNGTTLIALVYDIPEGIQCDCHPNPGVAYEGDLRTAYLPNNPEGRRLLTRFKYAWLTGHMLSVGRSHTHQRDNMTLWSSVPQKSNLRGGPFGFPDPHYLEKAHHALDRLELPTSKMCLELLPREKAAQVAFKEQASDSDLFPDTSDVVTGSGADPPTNDAAIAASSDHVVSVQSKQNVNAPPPSAPLPPSTNASPILSNPDPLNSNLLFWGSAPLIESFQSPHQHSSSSSDGGVAVLSTDSNPAPLQAVAPPAASSSPSTRDPFMAAVLSKSTCLSISRDPLMAAANLESSKQKLIRLLDVDPKRDPPDNEAFCDEDLWSPLIFRQKYKFEHFGLVETYPFSMLCAMGVRFDILRRCYTMFPDAATEKDTYGGYPLHHACECSGDNLEIVQWLAGIAPESLTAVERGCTPLHVACMSYLFHVSANKFSTIQTVQWLVEVAPENLTARDRFGMTPLHLAISEGAPIELVEVLVSQTNLTLLDDNDYSPLHWAVQFDGPGNKVLEILARTCAKAAVLRNKAGETPLDIALKKGLPMEKINILIKAHDEALNVQRRWNCIQ